MRIISKFKTSGKINTAQVIEEKKEYAKEHPIRNFLQNMVLGSAVAENPAVATATGWKRSPDGAVYQDPNALQSDAPEEQLRNNLSVIAAAGSAPSNAAMLSNIPSWATHTAYGIWGLADLPEDASNIYNRAKKGNYLGTLEGWNPLSEKDAGALGAAVSSAFDIGFIGGGAEALKNYAKTTKTGASLLNKGTQAVGNIVSRMPKTRDFILGGTALPNNGLISRNAYQTWLGNKTLEFLPSLTSAKAKITFGTGTAAAGQAAGSLEK